MANVDPRLELIMAYREAGLTEKADALAAEMLAEQGVAPARDFSDIRKGLDDISRKMDDVASRLGIQRRKRKR